MFLKVGLNPFIELIDEFLRRGKLKGRFKLGLIDKVYGDDDTISEWFECCEKVDDAYMRVGVTFVSKFARWNKYFYKGREITRKEAQRVARDYARILAQTPIGA